MKKATFFIVCAALIGCASYLLLVAQTKELPVAPVMLSPQPLMDAKPLPTLTPPQLIPIEVQCEIVDSDGSRRIIEETRYVFSPAVPREPQPLLNVGKFRIAIEYKLKNISPQSLQEFLEEQGHFHDIEMVNDDDADTILIKVSLDDHKIIQQMLVEIEREVEILRNNAAGSERLIKTFNVSPPSFGAIMPVFQSHCPSAIITPDNAKGLLIVVASESEMKRVEQFFEQIESAQKTVPTVRAQPLTPIDSPFLQ